MKIRKRDSGFSVLLLAVIISITTIIASVIISDSVKTSYKVSTSTNLGANAENYNRSGIAFFAKRWHEGQLTVDITQPLLANPAMAITTAATLVPPANRFWDVVSGGTSFSLKRCPPYEAFENLAGESLSALDATSTDCVETNNYAETTVTISNLTDSRLTAKVEATTTFPRASSSVVSAALINVPQHQITTEFECKIRVNGAEVSSIEVANDSTVDFELDFSPVLTNDIKMYIDGAAQTITIPAASPLVHSHLFSTSLVGGKVFNVKFELTGPGNSCSPVIEVGVDQPPPPCKWADPTYVENVSMRVCEVTIVNDTVHTYRVGNITNTPVGTGMGTTPDLSQGSGVYANCLESDVCQMRDFGALTVTGLTAATPTECYEAGNGAWVPEWNNARFVIGIFNTSNTDCSARISLARSQVDGCLPPQTLITMADGTKKPIAKVGTGEFVWNPLTNRGSKVRNSTFGPENQDLYLIEAAGRTIRATSQHPFFTPDGIVTAEKLEVGSLVQIMPHIFKPVTKLALDASVIGEDVWNLVLDETIDNSAFLADGFVVGDWKVQQWTAHPH